MKISKKSLCLAVILAMLMQIFIPFSQIRSVHAAAGDAPILIVAYFEYWQDPTTGKWLYDKSATERATLANGAQSTFAQYQFPSVSIDQYKIKDIQVYDPDAIKPANLQRWTEISDADIKIYKAKNIQLGNKEELLNKEGVVQIKAGISLWGITPDVPDPVHTLAYTKKGSNVKVYRNYVPIIVTYEPVSKSKLTINYYDEISKQKIKESETRELEFNKNNVIPIPEIPTYTFKYWIYDNSGTRRNENPVNVWGIEGEHTLDIYYKGPDTLNPYVTCWGTGTPNPATLNNGSATVSVEVNGEAFNLGSDSITSWTLSIQPPSII
ncbi:ubiquitin-activating E1 family protein [Thermotalea metallivorans]|uniref:Uncharacterized protein n=1 Tax=Thermotalea metallivorans TaxID=520762 RepID=A0A140L0C5_9FIRM|nr:hypothetical protein [Thermotalea metallivorans]KXG74000.1 hypothetical protein AN619_27050 [Thermotalea metallivorans]